MILYSYASSQKIYVGLVAFNIDGIATAIAGWVQGQQTAWEQLLLESKAGLKYRVQSPRDSVLYKVA